MLPSRTIVIYGPGLLLGATSESMTLLQPGSQLTSVAPVATEGCSEAHSLTLETMLDFESEAVTEATQTWVACPAAPRVYTDVYSSSYHQRLSGYLGLGYTLGTC